MPESEKQLPRYWIIVASRDHASIGWTEGIVQANHGKAAPLRRMHQGDWVIIYSGKESLGGDKKYQKFTAIAEVSDDEIFQIEMSKDFKPFRRRVKYMPGREVSIIPLIPDLRFIKNKQSWGYPFRFGFFEIEEHDFRLISERMFAAVSH